MDRQHFFTQFKRTLERWREKSQEALAMSLTSAKSALLTEEQRGLFHHLVEVEVESRELRRIVTALERFETGQFGVCKDCGADIPTARLEALYYATRCIECQRDAEQGTEERQDEPKIIGYSRIKRCICILQEYMKGGQRQRHMPRLKNSVIESLLMKRVQLNR